MKQGIRNSKMIKRATTLAAATGCLLLGSCASTTNTPPPGSAIIDAIPDPEHREGVSKIRLVSINGKSVKGTRSVIEPGIKSIKTQFRWPQGQSQQVDLRFYATPDTVYFIYYDMYPPSKEFDSRVARGLMTPLNESTDPMAGIFGAIFLAPPAAVIGLAERANHSITKRGASTTYIDLMVVARHTSQGVVRRVRVYPDGRIDEKPWRSGAQMQAP